MHGLNYYQYNINKLDFHNPISGQWSLAIRNQRINGILKTLDNKKNFQLRTFQKKINDVIYPISIVGKTDKGVISLVNNSYSGMDSNNQTNVNSFRYRTNDIFVGGKVESLDKKLFKDVQLTLNTNWFKEHLKEQISEDKLEVSLFDNDLKFDYGDYEINFSRLSLINDRAFELSIKSDSIIRIVSKKGLKSFNDFWVMANKVRNFVAFSTNSKIVFTSLLLKRTRVELPIRYYGKIVDEDAQSSLDFRVLLNFSEIETNKGIFEKWLSLNDRYPTLCQLYMANTGNNDQYIESIFMNYATALDSYTYERKDLDNVIIDKNSYKKDILPNLQSVIDKSTNLSNPEKDDFRGELRQLNSRSFRARLSSLFSKIENSIKEFHKKPEQLITRIKDTRNDIAHGELIDDSEGLLGLTYFTQYVIMALILSELGFEEQIIIKKLKSVVRYRYF
jgi:hypothetical protein